MSLNHLFWSRNHHFGNFTTNLSCKAWVEDVFNAQKIWWWKVIWRVSAPLNLNSPHGWNLVENFSLGILFSNGNGLGLIGAPYVKHKRNLIFIYLSILNIFPRFVSPFKGKKILPPIYVFFDIRTVIFSNRIHFSCRKPQK